MAASFVANCPHCLTERAAFSFIAETRTSDLDPTLYSVFFQCNICRRGIEVYLKCLSNHRPSTFTGNLVGGSFQILDVSPKPKVILAPSDVPENVTSAYLDAKDNLLRRRWNPAGVMFRRAVELALLNFVRKLQPSRESEFKSLSNLKARIDWVANHGYIAPDLRDWGHIIRLSGNDIHEENGITEADALDSAIFCEALLNYLFSLPEMINKRKTVSTSTASTA